MRKSVMAKYLGYIVRDYKGFRLFSTGVYFLPWGYIRLSYVCGRGFDLFQDYELVYKSWPWCARRPNSLSFFAGWGGLEMINRFFSDYARLNRGCHG